MRHIKRDDGIEITVDALCYVCKDTHDINFKSDYFLPDLIISAQGAICKHCLHYNCTEDEQKDDNDL